MNKSIISTVFACTLALLPTIAFSGCTTCFRRNRRPTRRHVAPVRRVVPVRKVVVPTPAPKPVVSKFQLEQEKIIKIVTKLLVNLELYTTNPNEFKKLQDELRKVDAKTLEQVKKVLAIMLVMIGQNTQA